MFRNIILFAVLVYELIGPLLTKQALIKAGDIVPVEEHEIKKLREEKLAMPRKKRHQ